MSVDVSGENEETQRTQRMQKRKKLNEVELKELVVENSPKEGNRQRNNKMEEKKNIKIAHWDSMNALS